MKEKTIKFEIYDGDAEVTVEITEDKIEDIITKIIDFSKRTNQVTGEGFAQNEDCNIYSSDILGDIWDDVLKPKVIWNN
jgi:hypothetical protein